MPKQDNDSPLDESTMPSDDELMGNFPDESNEEPVVLDADSVIEDEDGEEIVTNVEAEAPKEAPPAEKQQMVPHQAMHQERVARQQAEARNKELETQLQQLTGRLDQLAQMMQRPQEPQQPQEDPDPRPDPEEQPFEFMQWQQRRIEALEQRTEQERQQITQQQQFQAAMNEATEQAAQFRASLPDPTEYDEAYNYVFQRRGEELISMGVPREQVADSLRNEAVQGIMFARERGINPGQMLMNMAKARGFQYTGQQNPQPQPKQAAPAQPTQPPAEFRTMSDGQTLRSDTVDMQAVATMTDDEFESWMEKNGDKGLALLHGLR